MDISYSSYTKLGVLRFILYTPFYTRYMEIARSANFSATEAVYGAAQGSDMLRGLTYYTGLLPYELYVIPGMYLALMHALQTNDMTTIRVHILPHLLAFSVFQRLKHKAGRERPGCAHPKLGNFINKGHCHGKVRFSSMPSGHTGIASALLMALILELHILEDPKLFGIHVSAEARPYIASAAVFCTLMVALHRVAGGYHYVGDVLVGALLGSMIGIFSWKVTQPPTPEGAPEAQIPWWHAVSGILSALFALLLIDFVVNDVPRLTSVQH